MIEKNVIGTYNAKDAYPAMGYEAENGSAIAPVDYHIGTVSRVAGLSSIGTTIDPLEQWRVFSEQLRERRLAREGLAQANSLALTDRRQGQTVPIQTTTRNDHFQEAYEQDMVQLEHNYDPMALGLQRYLSSVRQPVPDEVQRIAPEDELEPISGAPGALRVASVMSRKVVCVLESTTVEQVASLCNQRGFSGVPIVDEKHSLRGVVTLSDIIRQLFDQKSVSTYADISGEILEQRTLAILDEPVRNYMKSQVITVTPDATVKEACQVMANHGIRRVIVTRGDIVLGIFSAQDAVRVLAASDLMIGE